MVKIGKCHKYSAYEITPRFVKSLLFKNLFEYLFLFDFINNNPASIEIDMCGLTANCGPIITNKIINNVINKFLSNFKFNKLFF